jgi:low molecular weight protein-tyrosine phosphatase
MAQYILQDMVNKAGLENLIRVDSAGIRVDRNANIMDQRAVNVLKQHNIPHDPKRYSKEIDSLNLDEFDYLVTMDRNLLESCRFSGNNQRIIRLLLDNAYEMGTVSQKDVIDPWHPDLSYNVQYEPTYELLRVGCKEFLKWLTREHGL